MALIHLFIRSVNASGVPGQTLAIQQPWFLPKRKTEIECVSEPFIKWWYHSETW